MSDNLKDNSRLKLTLFIGGWSLVLIGLALISFVALTAYEILETPQDVELIKYTLSQLPQPKDNFVFSGTLDSQEFTIEIPKEVSLFFYAFIGLLAFRVVGSTAIEIIKAGVNIWAK